jgi:N-dimethylarginine dimethylaminohydrolase
MAPEEFLQAAMNRLRYFLVTNADGYACYYFDTEEERRLWLKKAIEDNIIELGEDDAVYLDMNFMNLVEDKITMYAPPTEDVLTEDPDELSDS